MFENHKNYNCEITLDSGEQFKVYANWLHNNELDYWQGWNCQAGSRRLYIDKDLKVYSAVCQNDLLGSALDHFDLLDSTVCRQSRCNGCTDDLMLSKTQLVK